MLSKFIGIKVISEMPATRRAIAIILLIAIAELALFIFAITPAPYNFPVLFLNGLPLGMVFGLVLSFLEGRRVTEALSAGLCASFIVASGVVKSVGRSLVVNYGISEFWMPFVTGLVFVFPLIVGVLLLSKIPKPDSNDISQRSERVPMNRAERKDFFKRHFYGLTGLLFIYVMLTIIRSIRDDFAVEIWKDLGLAEKPNIYAISEMYVMLGVIAINGAAIWIKSNRSALLGSIGLILIGFGMVMFSLWGQRADAISPFTFMVVIGLGTYIPYVAFHTTIFERLIAAFQENGNIGYLMYLADAAGYFGYVSALFAKDQFTQNVSFLQLFWNVTLWICVISTVVSIILVVHFYRTVPKINTAEKSPAFATE